jgi:hypothetical protein
VFIFLYTFSGELFTWARRLNRLIASALIGFEFKDLQWSEYIEIFLNEYNLDATLSIEASYCQA